MRILQIIILGIVQGIAEFLPISSSAHLIIFRDVFGVGSFLVGELESSFDVALHFGTLLAIVIYFFKDFWNMIIKGLTKFKTKEGKLLWYVAAATVPAAVFGVLFEDKIDELVRTNYILIACTLAVMGIIIYVADKKSSTDRKLENITIKDALLIGFAQVFALIPGFSRSGTTIAMARTLKINRSDAAKFSFFLSAPVVFGAVFLKVIKGEMGSLISYDITSFIIGVVVSFVMGMICISFLMRYIKKHDYKIFMWYRLFIALAVLIVLYLR